MVGEFNAGKSAVINALLGEKLLNEGVTPTTSQINILRFGPEAERRPVEEGHEVIIRQHEELTRHFVPPGGPGAVHHLGRSPLYGERATVYGAN